MFIKDLTSQNFRCFTSEKLDGLSVPDGNTPASCLNIFIGEKITMTYQILSELFKDPFYYGLLFQANKTINLCDAYDFNIAVDEDDFNEVQRLSRAMRSPLVTNRRKTFYPLRGLVKCAMCSRSMTPGAS